MAQSGSQLVSLAAGTQFPSARYVDWLQVQGFLDMAESALRAKNAANDLLMQEKTSVLQHLTQQTEQNLQDVRQGQAEDTTFLRQQLEALLRERAAAKEHIAGLERENNFLLDEREILFGQIELEAGKAESDRSLRSLLSARRSEEDLSALRCDMPYPRRTRHQSLEPLTPQESVETIRPLSSQKAETRDSDGNDGHANDQRQEDCNSPRGNNAELGNAQGQHVTRPTAQSSSQVHGSSRQPLQLRPDHGNASSFLPDSPLHHQGSGDKQRFLPNNVSANAHKRF